MTARKTTATFVVDAIDVHQHKYDYSLVQYINTHSKVIIICPMHGKFAQRPNRHLQGDGCPACGDVRTGDAKFRTLQSIIDQCNAVHDNRYAYIKSEYHGINKKMSIQCHLHGEFQQTPSDHIYSSAGCPTCANLGKGQYRVLSPVDIIERSKLAHHNLYQYLPDTITRTDRKMTVICGRHGPFMPICYNHMFNMSGCPKCRRSKGELKIQHILEQHDVLYTIEKTFDDCRAPSTNYLLRFDFYLPSLNMLIEYDGEQHFYPTRIRGMTALHDIEQCHRKTVEHDHIKNEYALQNNIRILRIPYFKIKSIVDLFQEYGIIDISV